MTYDEMKANQDKRPLYHAGQRLKIVKPGTSLDGWAGVVRDINAVQSTSGYVMTYVYRLEMDNLARVDMTENDLQPLDSDS